MTGSFEMWRVGAFVVKLFVGLSIQTGVLELAHFFLFSKDTRVRITSR